MVFLLLPLSLKSSNQSVVSLRRNLARLMVPQSFKSSAFKLVRRRETQCLVALQQCLVLALMI